MVKWLPKVLERAVDEMGYDAIMLQELWWQGGLFLIKSFKVIKAFFTFSGQHEAARRAMLSLGFTMPEFAKMNETKCPANGCSGEKWCIFCNSILSKLNVRTLLLTTYFKTKLILFVTLGLGFATRFPILDGSFHLQEFDYDDKGETSNRGFAAGKVRLKNTGAIVMVIDVHLTGNYDCHVKYWECLNLLEDINLLQR